MGVIRHLNYRILWDRQTNRETIRQTTDIATYRLNQPSAVGQLSEEEEQNFFFSLLRRKTRLYMSGAASNHIVDEATSMCRDTRT